MTFTPGRVAISAITQALPCVVTTSSNHNLTTGQAVRLHVPQNYGMTPLNQKIFLVTVLGLTSFSIQYNQVPPGIDVDSRNFPAFMTPSNPGFTAEVLCVGAGPTPVLNTPVQVLDNTCVTQTDDATRNVATTNQPF